MFGPFDFGVILRNLPYLMKVGMTFTLTLTALAIVLGVFFGTLLAMMRLSSFKALSLFATGYINLMRSVPLVLVIFWFYPELLSPAALTGCGPPGRPARHFVPSRQKQRGGEGPGGL